MKCHVGFAAFAVCLLAGSLQAHPHIFVDVRGRVELDEQAVTGVEMIWRFDAMSTTMVLSDCDDSWNDQIDPEEEESFGTHYLQDLREGNFSATWSLDEEDVDDESFGRFEFVGFENRGEPITLKLRADMDLPLTDEQQTLTLKLAHPVYLVAYTFTDKWQTGHEAVKIRARGDHLDIFLPGRAPETGGEMQAAEVPDQPVASPTLRERFFQIQASVNRRMNTAILAAREQYVWPIMITLFPLAAAYGLVHAAGPGHGKSLVIGFFLHRPARARSAVTLACLVTFMHSAGALVLAGIFHTLLADVKGIARIRMQGWLTFAVAMGIVSYGAWTVLRSLLRLGREEEEAAEQMASRRGMLGIGLLAGLVPCPFTVAVLLLALTHGMPLPGLAAVLGIMAGTFVLLTTVGFVTIRAGGRVRSARKEGKSRRAVHQGLGVLGGVLIVMAGVALAMLYYPAYGR